MSEDNWIGRNWRPLCGITYIVICLFDFLVAPAWYAYVHSSYDIFRVFDVASRINNGNLSLEVVRILQHRWEPVTLGGAGTFHMAFGAILGVAAWTRGAEKVEVVRANAAVKAAQASRPITDQHNG